MGSDAVFFGPDTDRFVNLILSELTRSPLPEGGRILDLGCGAGAGGIVVAALVAAPGRLETWLTDINPHALAFALANASHSKCAVECRKSDLLNQVDGQFDLIVSNPPYLNDAAERAYRHGGGRWGEALSLRIVREALPRLKPRGRLVLYTGSAIVDGDDLLREQIERELDDINWPWRYRELDPDVFGEELEQLPYQGVDRLAAVAFVVERPSEPAYTAQESIAEKVSTSRSVEPMAVGCVSSSSNGSS